MYSWSWSIVSLLTLVPLHIGYGLPCTYVPEEGADAIKCQSTRYEICKKQGYNVTSFPNILNHSNQDQAIQFLESLHLDYTCSLYLIHFVCSTTFPLCTEGLFQQIGPCREMCYAVRESCGPVFDRLGINCNLFQRFATSTVPCIWNSSDCNVASNRTQGGSTGGDSPGRRGRTNCTGHLTPLANNTPTRDASFAGVDHCTESCQGVFFDSGQQNLIVIWITTWSLVTLFVSAVMFLTYILNFKNIPSLEAPIYYIALCCAVSALCYTLSVAIGSNSLICDKQFMNQFNESAVVVDGLSSPLCASMFGLLYYFTLCMWSWWAVLCIQWLLCSLRFADVSDRWKPCFHIAAWGLPLPFLVSALSLNHVTGDPIMHTCWIEKHKELPYLIVPLSLCLLLCSVIVIVSFAKVVKLQNISKPKASQPVDQIDHRTLVRVGLYCTLFMLPMGMLLCVYFYEYWFRDQWELDYLQCSVLRLSNCLKRTLPLLPLFLAKITASLLMGILSFFWMIKGSTAVAWRKVFCFFLAAGHTERQSFSPADTSTPVIPVTPNSQQERFNGTLSSQKRPSTSTSTSHKPSFSNLESSV